MTKKKPPQSNTPRRKRFKREQRLVAAESWLPTYEGKNILGNRKRYGVDWPTALRELEMLGVLTDQV